MDKGLWKTQLHLPSRVERLLEKAIRPDAFFCIDNKPLVLFFQSPQDKDIYKKIWNFNESPVVIILDNDKVTIYNGFKFDTVLKELSCIGGEEKIDDFTYFALVTGKTWEQHQEDFAYENRLDYFLLNNIKVARNILVEENHLTAKVANALIGKCIFIRYLIDRGVKLNIGEYLKNWDNDGFCELLKNKSRTKDFFDYMSNKFNGDDIFAITNNEYKTIKKDDLSILIRLLKSENLKVGQPSLFNVYDFSIIPIEFISNVYELFIGKDKQEEKGAYYTPLFLVDYILAETIEKHFAKYPKAEGCVILDPACGSGIFLVESLRKIIEQYRINNPSLNLTPTRLCNIASKNIYGIDNDLSAIQVALFSVYLTLLDYQKPPDIEKFKFPSLLDKNFFKADFFDTDAKYNTVFKTITFDYILGNPPWKGGGLGDTGGVYLKKRKKVEKEANKKYSIEINNKEIAEGFVLRASDFSQEETKIAFIIRSSILYNMGYEKCGYSKFRRYLLEEFFIHKIVELAPVRHEVFDRSNDPSIAPAAIIFYQYAKEKLTDDNVMVHITVKPGRFFFYFKIFTIMRPDYKEVEQKLLKQYDWLFKTLVYGSYLDFNFIRRLRKNYPSIRDIISKKDDFIYGKGIHYSGEALSDPKDTRNIENIQFISSLAITAFHIDYGKQNVLEKNKIDRLRDARLFQAPMLLVREGIDMELLNAKAAVSLTNILFKDSITSVKSLDKELSVLKTILGIMTSNLYSYIAINTFSSIGIERDRMKDYNMFDIPYINCNIVDFVVSIEKSMIDLQTEEKNILNDLKCLEIQNNIDKAKKEINFSIEKMLKVTDEEGALIDYALTINRPLIPLHGDRKYSAMQNLIKPLQEKAQELIEYAKVFFDRFKPDFDNNQQKFIARIWCTDQIIGMFFEVVPIETQTENDIIWDKADANELLSLLIKLSSEKITDRLFVQKDIRGFEKERFYVFKPNEKRLWHKAIAYLDAAEFMDAILRAGRDGK
jgi:hypothetical protein